MLMPYLVRYRLSSRRNRAQGKLVQSKQNEFAPLAMVSQVLILHVRTVLRLGGIINVAAGATVLVTEMASAQTAVHTARCNQVRSQRLGRSLLNCSHGPSARKPDDARSPGPSSQRVWDEQARGTTPRE